MRPGPFPLGLFNLNSCTRLLAPDLASQGQALMTISPCYIGCDISKCILDLHDPSSGKAFRIANTADQIARLADQLAGRNVIVVMEATGAYDRAVRTGLAEAGIGYVRVNPTRARRFADAVGLLAKTDAIDARMLSAMGQTMKLVPDAPEDPDRKTLHDLQKRRDQLVQIRADEKNRADLAEPEIARSVASHIAWLNQAIAELDDRIERFIADRKALAQTRAILLSAPGIGPVSANVLIAQMSELGRLSPKKIACLAGLAPINQDSGTKRGARHIKGGRRRVRQALYMAALAATRCSKRLGQFYERIKHRSKSVKIAIIATARKLLTILNAMIRDNVPYHQSRP